MPCFPFRKKSAAAAAADDGAAEEPAEEPEETAAERNAKELAVADAKLKVRPAGDGDAGARARGRAVLGAFVPDLTAVRAVRTRARRAWNALCTQGADKHTEAWFKDLEASRHGSKEKEKEYTVRGDSVRFANHPIASWSSTPAPKITRVCLCAGDAGGGSQVFSGKTKLDGYHCVIFAGKDKYAGARPAYMHFV